MSICRPFTYSIYYLVSKTIFVSPSQNVLHFVFPTDGTYMYHSWNYQHPPTPCASTIFTIGLHVISKVIIMEKSDIQQKIFQIERLMMELRIKGIYSVLLVWDDNNDICMKGNLAVGNLLANFHTEFVFEIEQNNPTYWIDRMVIPKLNEPIDKNPRDDVCKHLSKIIWFEQNLGKAHIDYSTKPEWWDDKIIFSKDYSITGKMNKPHLVQMTEIAYKYHITDSTGLHIERSQLAFEIAIMDKQVFLSRFSSEIIPRIQERGANSEIKQSVDENFSEGKAVVCTSEGKQGSSEKSNILDGKIKITDANIEAMVASLSSLSPINRFLLSNNIEEWGVYIPETVTVASSSSQISRNQFLVPVPDPICSTRIFPEVSCKNVLQSKSESVHDHDAHEV